MSADIYWIEAVTQGRLAILGRPRSGDWLSDEIGGWKTAGLTHVVSLLEAHEVRDLDLAREADMAAGVGLVNESSDTSNGPGVTTRMERDDAGPASGTRYIQINSWQESVPHQRAAILEMESLRRSG